MSARAELLITEPPPPPTPTDAVFPEATPLGTAAPRYWLAGTMLWYAGVSWVADTLEVDHAPLRIPLSNAVSALSSTVAPAEDVLPAQLAIRNLYKARLDQLQGFAEEDDINLRNGSKEAFFGFVEEYVVITRASLVLLDSGNLRSVWRGEAGEIGAEFKGDGTVLYVLSLKSGGEKHLNADRGATADLVAAVNDAELDSLLFG